MNSRRGAAVLATAALPLLGLLAGCSSAGGASAGSTERPAPTAAVSGTPSPARPAAPSSTSSSGGIRARPADPPPATNTVQPIRLQLTAVGIDVPVVPVGVAQDGQMALPPNPATIGWYRFGPSTTDQRGSVVVGGHIDSKQYGVGPLVRLRKVQPGDSIVIRLTGNASATYKVQSVDDIPKTSLALDKVFDRDGARMLRIITCGGPYDHNGGGYRDNLVVTALPA